MRVRFAAVRPGGRLAVAAPELAELMMARRGGGERDLPRVHGQPGPPSRLAGRAWPPAPHQPRSASASR